MYENNGYAYKGVRKGGSGVKPSLELEILQKRYYLRNGD